MAKRRTGTKRICFLSGSIILLSVSFTAFHAGSNGAKIAACAGIVSALFASLIYLQLKFYRDGDEQHIKSRRALPSTNATVADCLVKSSHHRAIWENLEQTRILMRYKEQEFLQARLIEEKQALRLPEDEEILFMADRSRLYFWPVAFLSLILLFTASVPSGEFPAAVSFACLVSGLFGLLVLVMAKFGTRYYLTNFRILVRHKRPMRKAQWSSLGYPGIQVQGRVRKFARQELKIKSGEETISIRGLPRHKFRTVIGVLLQRLPEFQSSLLEFYP